MTLPATWIGMPPGVQQQIAQRLARGAEGDALELGAVGRLQHAAHVVLADDLGELHVASPGRQSAAPDCPARKGRRGR